MTREDSAEFRMGERQERFLTSTWGALLAAAFCCLLWGSAFPCIKIGYALFGIAGTDTASQMLFAGTRFLLAGAMVIVFVSIARRRPLAAFSQVKVDSSLCRFPTLRSGHARTPSFRYQRA